MQIIFQIGSLEHYQDKEIPIAVGKYQIIIGIYIVGTVNEISICRTIFIQLAKSMKNATLSEIIKKSKITVK